MISAYIGDPKKHIMPIDTANARKVKLPDFMSSDPTTWVNLCKAVFASHSVTDPSNKYNVMVVALPVQVLGKVKTSSTHHWTPLSMGN